MVYTNSVKQDRARLKIKMRLAEDFVAGVRLLLVGQLTSGRSDVRKPLSAHARECLCVEMWV